MDVSVKRAAAPAAFAAGRRRRRRSLGKAAEYGGGCFLSFLLLSWQTNVSE